MTPSNVLILSAYPPGLHQYGIEQALRRLGHRVFTAGRASSILADLEQALQRHHPGYAYDLVVAPDAPLDAILAACPFAPDFVLYLEAATPCLPAGLEHAPCPVIALLTEDLLNADLYSTIIPYFDLALCTWKSTEASWRGHGHDNVVQWYYGARPEFCVDEGLERVWDVAFLGNLNPRVQRRRLPMVQKLLRLRDEGVRVFVGGNLYFEAYNRVHAQARIVYHQGITDQVNMRVFEAMGAGCLVVMRRPCDPDDPTTRFFRDRHDVVYCDTDDEALALIRYYLAHEEERAQIARAGHDTVVARHSYEDVVTALVTEILPRVPADLAAARRRRRERFGKDERRERLDYARFFLTFGALEASQAHVHVLPGYAEDPEARHLLGLLFAAAGRADVAVHHLERVCALDPRALLARVNLATVALNAGHADAERWCAQALAALEAADAGTLAAAAVEGAYFPFDYDRFRIEVSHACIRHPAGPERRAALVALYRWRLHALMARHALDRGRHAEALAHGDRAAALVADDGYVLHDRARAAAALGDRHGTVLDDLRRAVELEPFFAEAQLDLAAMLQQRGQDEAAFAHLWDVARHNPLVEVPLEMWRHVGALAERLGKHAQADLAFAEALTRAPDDPELQARVAGAAEPPPRASVIVTVDDARLAQRAIMHLRENTEPRDGWELIVIKRGGGRAIDAFLRAIDGPVTVIPGGVSAADDLVRAAEAATGTHLVFLDSGTMVQPGWLAPLLDAAGEGISVPRVADGGADAQGMRAAHCACVSRALWQRLGGFTPAASGPRAIDDLATGVARHGGCVAVADQSVVAVDAAVAPADPGAGAGARPGGASVATPATHPASPSRGLRHIARPPDAYFDFARPEVAALVPAEARRILDVGCGGGALGALLKQRPGVEVVGIEGDADAAAVARGRLDGVLSVDLEALDALPADVGAFDCIVCADVLEHLVDPERTLAALLPSLRDGGSVIVSIPNVRHQDVVLDLLVNGRWRYQPSGILDATHLRFYTAEEVAGLLDRLGLHVEAAHANGSEPDARMASLAGVVGQLGGNAERFLKESRIIQFVFRARRAPVARLAPPAAGAARPDEPRPRKASIVVLAWNELEYTRECVKSILACTPEPYELILVDNGSADATLEFFRSVPNAKVVANGANLGFAGGNNRGLLAATGDYVVLLNNDTLVTEGWLEGLIACAAEDPAIGIVGPMSNYVSGPQLVPSVAYGDFAELQAFAREFRARHRGRRMALNRIVGFCMLITREALSRVGLLDERFGLGNFEDDDYCLRARQAGFRLVVAADVFVHHFGSRTFAGQGIDFAAAMKHGQDVFAQKWQPGLAAGAAPGP